MAWPKRLLLGVGAAMLALLLLSVFDPSANAKTAQAEAWSLFALELQPKVPIAFETINHGDGASWMPQFKTVPLRGISIRNATDYRLKDANGNPCVKISTVKIQRAGLGRWEVAVRSTFGFDAAGGRTYVLQSIFGRWRLIETKDHWIT